MSARQEIKNSKFTRKSVGRNAFKDLRKRGFIDKRGQVTSKGVEFFSSLFDTINSLSQLEEEEQTKLS